MQKILIEGYEYEVLEIKEKVTIADSFVVRSNKKPAGKFSGQTSFRNCF